MALIELDLYAPPDPPPPPARSGRHRAFALAGVLVLLLALAGGSPAAAFALWQQMGVAPIATPTGAFHIIDGRLYTFDATGTRLLTSAWSMDPIRMLWSRVSQVPAPGPDGLQPGLGWSVSAAGGGNVLLQADRSSSLIDAETGAVRWTLPEVVRPLADGRTGLTYGQEFPPGSTYDAIRGAQGALYFGDDGTPHTQPPVRTTLRAVDLQTGRERWRRSLPGPAVAVGAPGDPHVVLVVASNWLGRLDTGTGAVQLGRTVDGPAPRDLSEADIFGALVLVRHGAPGNGGTVTAYSTRTLDQLWRRTEPVEGGPAFCDDVLCDYQDDGVAVLDAVTGRELWHTTDDAGLVAHGTDVIEVTNGGTRPLRVRDAVTGVVRVELGQWTYSTASPAADPLVVGHLSGARSVFGVLLPGARSVQPLGYASTPVSDCESDDRFVVCRVIDGAEIWAYRSAPVPHHG